MLFTSDRELESLKRQFAELDKDGDGKITLQEYREVMRAVDPDMTEDDLKGIVDRAATKDKDGNGSLSFEEFHCLVRPYQKLKSQDKEADLKKVFLYYDWNRNGKVKVADSREFMLDLTVILTEGKLEAILEAVETDGTITWEKLKEVAFKEG